MSHRGRVETTDGALRRHCGNCDAVVESTLRAAFGTKITETILCPACGADNSVRPSMIQRWRYGHARAQRRRRVGGFFWWARYAPWKCWLMPYELERPDKPVTPREERAVC